MKKTYMIPTLMVVKIKTAGMIATSLPKDDTLVDDNNDVLGRGSDWDEDEY